MSFSYRSLIINRRFVPATPARFAVGVALLMGLGAGCDSSIEGWESSALDLASDDQCAPISQIATQPSPSPCGDLVFVYTGFGPGLYEITVDPNAATISGLLQDPDATKELVIPAEAAAQLSAEELSQLSAALDQIVVGADSRGCPGSELDVEDSWYELQIGDLRFSQSTCGDVLRGEEGFAAVVDIFRNHLDQALPTNPTPIERCAAAYDASAAKAVSCGLEVETQEPPECTEQQASSAECQASCIEAADCLALTGEDEAGTQAFGECISTCPEF
jgi:hypothetical protein